MKRRRFVIPSILFFILLYSVTSLEPPQFIQVSGCSEIAHAHCVEVRQCGDLTQADTYYLLMNDISSQRTCVFITASNTIFDLNGYTLTYGDTPLPHIPNYDFEQGTGGIADSWDTSRQGRAHN